jgi:hypothetical protein
VGIGLRGHTSARDRTAILARSQVSLSKLTSLLRPAPNAIVVLIRNPCLKILLVEDDLAAPTMIEDLLASLSEALFLL